MSPSNSPDRLMAFVRVSLILLSSSALLGAMMGPLLLWFPSRALEGQFTLYEVLLWPIGTVAKFREMKGPLDLIVYGALGYGLLGWAFGISIWGLWQAAHGKRDS